MVILSSKYSLEMIEPLDPVEAVSESGFLHEFAWVILCGGIAESVILGASGYSYSGFAGMSSRVYLTRKQMYCS